MADKESPRKHVGSIESLYISREGVDMDDLGLANPSLDVLVERDGSPNGVKIPKSRVKVMAPPEEGQGDRGAMRTQVYYLGFESVKSPEFIDITDSIRDCVEKAGISTGFVVVYSKHTTASIKINENEPLLLQDMEQFLERMSPRNGEYKHNDFKIRTVNMTEDECPNGHAHCQHLLLGTSETIPIVDGAMQFGRWQSIFLIELDHPRAREVVVQVLGA